MFIFTYIHRCRGGFARVWRARAAAAGRGYIRDEGAQAEPGGTTLHSVPPAVLP
jgi:hypothetical protein